MVNVATVSLTRGEVIKEIAASYFREGDYPAARALLNEALADTSEFSDTEIIKLKITLALVEQWDGKQEAALSVLAGVAQLVKDCKDKSLKGNYYVSRAFSERRLALIDEAIDSLTSASIYYEGAQEWRLRADVENNLGNIKVDAGRVADAHEHYERALQGCDDPVVSAQINESQASAYLAEGKPFDALPYALKSVQLLEGSERKPLLKEHIHTLNRVCDEIEQLFNSEDERARIADALARCPGRITAAAKLLGIKHQTLRWKLDNQYNDLEAPVPPKKKARGPHAPKRSKRAKRK